MALISHLKCCFKHIYEKKLQNFSLQGLLFVCCRLNVYQSALIFRNLPCPEKFLVMCLRAKSLFLLYRNLSLQLILFISFHVNDSQERESQNELPGDQQYMSLCDIVWCALHDTYQI